MPWSVKPPKNDDEYFERMTKIIFQAGLNWKMIDNKWPEFRKAFSNFSIDKVSKFDDKKVEELMGNAKIVRNRRKILSTIYNAKEFKVIQQEFKSFQGYMTSFRGAELGLQNDIHERFKHLGPHTARMYLWMAGVKLTPNAEEKAWIDSHDPE